MHQMNNPMIGRSDCHARIPDKRNANRQGANLPCREAAQFNNALDRTAMSAVPSVIADSWPVAALMAVGQLGRYA